MSEESYLTPDELATLTATFYVQTKEILDDFSDQALALETADEVAETVRSLERAVHTIKGDSMALGFDSLSKLAHRLEDYFHALRDIDTVGREEIDLVLASGDTMMQLLEAYCAVPRRPLPSLEPLFQRLSLPTDSFTKEIPLEGRLYRLLISFAKDCQMRSAGAFLVCRRVEKVARIVAMTPDPDSKEIESVRQWALDLETGAKKSEIRRAARVPGVTSRIVLKELTRLENRRAPETKAETAAAEAETTPGRAQGSHGPGTSDQLRVEVSKIDRIMNLVGELVIGRSMVAQALSDLSRGERSTAAVDRLGDANGFLERTLTELQAAVLKIRMVPMEHVFRRFPRLVRDLAHARARRVELEIEGGLTELDKSIVDALGEPLLHLVRNAIDHGLESPEERGERGKSAVGHLKLAAFYEGNHAHVVVEDDGRGIDIASVGERAVTLGMLEPSQLDAMTPSDILNCIYEPGFSTRETVSDISGRGIGMDVVRESIEKLKGVIDLETAPGRGTRFVIRLPLTLAILRAVLVEAAGKAFAVPLTGVLEIVRLPGEDGCSVRGQGVLRWRDLVVPLISLRDTLGLGTKRTEKNGFVLLVGEAERRVGLVADRLLGEQELVVKPIEDPLSRSPGIAGASILGDGRVVLILHTRGLLDKHVSLSRRVEVLR